MPIMSLGQIAEIVAMCILARMLTRLGTKLTLLLGLLAEIGRFAAFAFGTSTFSVLAGNACHGLAYTFYFTAVYITLDTFCNKQSRTGLHQLFTIITSGFGALSANLLGGYCLDRFVNAPAIADYRTFWGVPLVMAIISFAVLAVFLKDPKKDHA